MPDTTLDVLGADALREVIFGERRVRDRMDAEVKWHAAGDPELSDAWVLTGYPAVTGVPTVLYESKNLVMRETIAPGAFSDVLADDCHLNYSHESPSAMCRNGLSGTGGMEIMEDGHGLRLYALVPKDDIDAQRLAPKMKRGVVNQMSFAFTVGQEDCLQTEDEQGRSVYDYTINKVQRLYDVTVCPLGAYSQTEAMLRSLSDHLAARSVEGTDEVPCRSEEEGTEAVRSAEGQADPTDEDRLVYYRYQQRRINA